MQRMRGDGGCRTASQRQLTPPPAHKAAHQGAHELKGASYQGGGKPGAQAAVWGRKPGDGRGRRVGSREGGRWRRQQLAAPPAPAPGCWTGAQELRGASNQASRGPEPEQTALQVAGCAGQGRGKETGVDARESGGGACAPRLGTQGQSRNKSCLRVGGRGARGAQWFRVAARLLCRRLQPYHRARRGSSTAVCRGELPKEASREAETGAHRGQDRKEGPTGGKERVESGQLGQGW